MSNLLVLKGKCLFHLTHVDNIPAILKLGILCKNLIRNNRVKYVDISHDDIQEKRAQIDVPLEPGGTLHDYVPAFFGARPPMLMAVQRKGFAQEDMVYAVIDWNILRDRKTIFTDGNARSGGTEFYKGVENLDKVDFQAAGEKYWGDKGKDYKRKKQAEVLRHEKVVLDEVLGFVVYNDGAKRKLDGTLRQYGVAKKVFVVPEYYY